MKKALISSLAFGGVFLILSFLFNISGGIYGTSMQFMLEEDFPGFLEVVQDYGINSYEPIYDGYTKGEVVALDTLYNMSFRVDATEKLLKEKIKEADPFNNGSNDEKVTTLKDALRLVQQIKDKYYVKAKIIDALLQAVPMAFFLFVFSMIGEGISRLIWGKKGPSWERDYEAEKDNKVEEDEYPSRRITDKPKGLN